MHFNQSNRFWGFGVYGLPNATVCETCIIIDKREFTWLTENIHGVPQTFLSAINFARMASVKWIFIIDRYTLTVL